MNTRILFLAILLPYFSCGQQSFVERYNQGITYYNNNDYRNAVILLKPIAEQGNVTAQLILGFSYDQLENYSEAITWFRQSAQQGNVHAQFRIGYYYYDGKAVAKDYREAEKWYMTAMNNSEEMSADNHRIMNEHLKIINMLYRSPGGVIRYSPAGYNKEAVRLKVSHCILENIIFEGREGAIIIENIPQTPDWNYVALSLKSAGEQELNEEVFPRNNPIVYSLKHLPDGYYFLNLYRSSRQNSEFTSYILGKDIVVYKLKNKIRFMQSPVLDNNKSIYESWRTDAEALEYYLKPTNIFQSDNEAIITLAQRITRGISDDYYKAKAIHDWVCNNLWYDMDEFMKKTSSRTDPCIAILKRKRGVCGDFSTVAATLLRAVGIPAKIISGHALGEHIGWTNFLANDLGEADHGWNATFINGRWIMIDTTWDCNNEYADNSFSKNAVSNDNRYFDITIEMLSMTHKLFDEKEEIPQKFSVSY